MKKIKTNINLDQTTEIYSDEGLIKVIRNPDIGEYIPQDIIGKGLEFQQITKHTNRELRRLWELLNRLLDDLYIQRATRTGLEKYAELIGVELPDDIEDARKLIFNLWNTATIWTERTLKKWLDHNVGKNKYILNLIINEYALILEVIHDGTAYSQAELYEQLRRIIPANLTIELRIRILEKLIFKELTKNYLNRLYPTGNLHQCGTIYNHQYTGRKYTVRIPLANNIEVRAQRIRKTGEGKAGE